MLKNTFKHLCNWKYEKMLVEIVKIDIFNLI